MDEKTPERRLINLTPHPMVVYGEDAKTVLCTIPSSGVVRTQSEPQRSLGSLSVPWQCLKDPENEGSISIPLVTPQIPTTLTPESHALLEQFRDCDIIVSLYCPPALRDWPHQVLTPDSGPVSAVRDSEGKILGVRRLQRH
jgi:hypothetical protein